MGKTKYRIVNYDGYNSFLEYEVEEKYFFNLFTRTVWRSIWKPYFDNVRGRDNPMGLNNNKLYVNSYDSHNQNYLEEFTKKWPNIEDYFKFSRIKQSELEDKTRKYWDGIESKKGVNYL